MTCTEMCGSAVLTGTELWRMARILKVLPRDRAGCYMAAAGATVRTAAPRPAGTTTLRRARSTTTASA